MATWDGSCPSPEDQNYYLYADQNAAGPSAGNWQYFSGNVNGTYMQNGREFYYQNGPMYDQDPSPYYTVNEPMNMVSLANNYYQQHSPHTVNHVSQNNAEYYPASTKSVPNVASSSYRTNKHEHVSKYNKNSNKHRSSKVESVQQSVHINSTQKSEGNRADVNEENNLNDISQDISSKASRSRSKSYGRYQDKGKPEKRIDNRGNSNNINGETSYDQPQKDDAYRKSYWPENSRSYGRFQRGKYSNNRQYTKQHHANGSDINSRQAGNTSRNEISDAQESISNFNVGATSSRDSAAQGTSFNYRQFQNHSRYNKKYPGTKYDRYETGNKERRYNNQGYNGSKEYSTKEIKSDAHETRDKQRNVAENDAKPVENWRSRKDLDDKTSVQKKKRSKKHGLDDDASQRERLSDQLNRGILECLVCCENIKQNDYVWSCINCYHVLHLKCIKKWAKSSQSENGWRCPACQNVNLEIPKDYFCFCGKTKAPEWNRRDVAHSCGEICGRTLSKNSCVHKCTLLCHPGSCPVCIAMVTKNCGCGKTSQTLQCSTHTALFCDSICEKQLNCERHNCERKCHGGECGRCDKLVEQVCYCTKNKREVTCDKDIPFTYACDEICGKQLNCGNHTCQKLCHEGECEPCSLTPDKVMTCCCGQTPLEEKRESCLDSIPTCDKVCSKNLKCGQPNNPHRCKANCHVGDCPVCDLTTDVKCRCGNMDREIPCKDLRSKADDARCEKRCLKRRSCAKHKCNQLCCIDIEHICPLPCSKTLSCGRHKCELRCHNGRCQPCWRSSFEELYCECGAAVIYPPVPCGTRRPPCDKPCSRQHACGHEVLHNCHSEPTCPPCSVLTQRWCHGHHELRKSVLCHLGDISCGLPCDKPISCGRHKCINICHAGACEKPGQQCVQPCTIPKELCGHNCAAPCHDGPCPETPCKEIVKVTCQCGHRTMSRPCAENSKEYQRIASNILASKMADMQLGHAIDLEEVFGQGAKKQNQLKTLECNDDCKIIERNRKLSLGLQIVNPDLSGKLMPRYSDFMKQWGKKDPLFCQMVHEKLTELVKLSKTSKHKSRSYSFESMNREKRHFIHESCEHFGCESQAYDHEPKRNVVATAVKDKCWLPSYSLLEIIERENGQRKVPLPVFSSSNANGSAKTVLPLQLRKIQQPAPTSFKAHEKEEIDYFDYEG